MQQHIVLYCATTYYILPYNIVFALSRRRTSAQVGPQWSTHSARGSGTRRHIISLTILTIIGTILIIDIIIIIIITILITIITTSSTIISLISSIITTEAREPDVSHVGHIIRQFPLHTARF